MTAKAARPAMCPAAVRGADRRARRRTAAHTAADRRFDATPIIRSPIANSSSRSRASSKCRLPECLGSSLVSRVSRTIRHSARASSPRRTSIASTSAALSDHANRLGSAPRGQPVRAPLRPAGHSAAGVVARRATRRPQAD
jgi:hypothetical protein